MSCKSVFSAMALASFLAVFGAATASAETLCAAHRGNSAEELENSMAALRSAVSIGAPIVEFDVRHTFDGQAIVFHDARLKRTAASREGRRCRLKAKLKKLTLRQIRENCVLKNGEEIPTLREALDELSRTRVGIFLELKDMPNLRTLRLIDDYYRTRPSLLRVLSFKQKVLAYVRNNLPEAMTFGGVTLFHATNFGKKASTLFGGATIRRPSQKHIDRLQAMGIEVSAWTLNSEKAIRRYVEAGVDYITTDNPRLCLQIAQTGQSR